MNCVSCDICVYHLGLFVFFPRVFLSSRVTRACPVTTDLIMRVNVRTTTTHALALSASQLVHKTKNYEYGFAGIRTHEPDLYQARGYNLIGHRGSE